MNKQNMGIRKLLHLPYLWTLFAVLGSVSPAAGSQAGATIGPVKEPLEDLNELLQQIELKFADLPKRTINPGKVVPGYVYLYITNLKCQNFRLGDLSVLADKTAHEVKVGISLSRLEIKCSCDWRYTYEPIGIFGKAIEGHGIASGYADAAMDNRIMATVHIDNENFATSLPTIANGKVAAGGVSACQLVWNPDFDFVLLLRISSTMLENDHVPHDSFETHSWAPLCDPHHIRAKEFCDQSLS